MATEAPKTHGETLSMSDEDFLKLGAPDGAPISASEPNNEEQPNGGAASDPNPEDGEGAGGEDSQTGTNGDDTVAGSEGSDTVSGAASGDDTVAGSGGNDTVPGSTGSDSVPGATGDDTVKAADGDDTLKGGEADDKLKKPDASSPGSEAQVVSVPLTFRANGKDIQLKSAEEAIQLMQMGANYTRKLQELTPHRKMITMLEKNELLDEGKLSFMIDVMKGDPEAIKLLMKDKSVDPLEIDMNVEPTYLGGSHTVSDEEVNFRTTLDEVGSTQAGKETISIANKWDQTSKELLWKSPEALTIIHAQREAGIYDRITTELDRQKLLGRIGPNVPFLQAYKQVGDEMTEAGAFNDLVPPAPKTNEGGANGGKAVEPPTPVATTVAAPKPPAANGDQAKAASPTRSSPREAKTVVNPLAMSDEEFLKNFNGRL